MQVYILFLILTLISFQFPLSAQTEMFTDPRDGNSYPLIKIGNHSWFYKNLSYEMPRSHCFDDNPLYCDSMGRYYHRLAMEHACPEGWHVITLSDYHHFFEHFSKSYQMEITSQTGDTTSVHFSLFENNEMLNLVSTGWLEGDDFDHTENGTTFWLESRKDPTANWHWHIPMEKRFGYIIHNHDFHVIDKEKKVRSFNIRCVKD